MNFNPYLPTYSEFLTESSKEGFVSAVINASLKMIGFGKGEEVQINALQYTKGKDSDKIECINKKGQATTIEKYYLTVKF